VSRNQGRDQKTKLNNGSVDESNPRNIQQTHVAEILSYNSILCVVEERHCRWKRGTARRIRKQRIKKHLSDARRVKTIGNAVGRDVI